MKKIDIIHAIDLMHLCFNFMSDTADYYSIAINMHEDYIKFLNKKYFGTKINFYHKNQLKNGVVLDINNSMHQLTVIVMTDSTTYNIPVHNVVYEK